MCITFCGADAAMNHNGKFALHVGGFYGGPGASCDFVMTDCMSVVTHVVSPGGEGARWDIYVIAMDVTGIAGARYGLRTEQPVGKGLFFYGWTSCSLFDISTSGWPGAGEAISQAWSAEQPGPHVTMGILDVYLYPGSNAKLCTAADPRVGYAQFCDGSEPLPLCNKHYGWVHTAFGCVGFNRLGYNPCDVVPTENLTWGVLKGLYR
jgi:hypothetical protein